MDQYVNARLSKAGRNITHMSSGLYVRYTWFCCFSLWYVYLKRSTSPIYFLRTATFMQVHRKLHMAAREQESLEASESGKVDVSDRAVPTPKAFFKSTEQIQSRAAKWLSGHKVETIEELEARMRREIQSVGPADDGNDATMLSPRIQQLEASMMEAIQNSRPPPSAADEEDGRREF